MGRKFEIIVIALMVVCVGVTGAAIAHQKAEIDKIRSGSIASLEKALPLSDYRKKQQKQVKEILDKYEKKIGEARTKEEADSLIDEAKAEAKPIKTDKQLTKIEKKKAAEKAKREAEEREAEEAAEAARQAEQEQSYSNSGSGNSNTGSSSGSSAPSGSDGCVDPNADLI